MNRKTFERVEIKSESNGIVEAVFATFGVKDRDGDVTVPGAFEDGAEVLISAYGHASWGPARGQSSVPLLPVGKGKIRTTDKEAILDGRFFLDTAGGRETFAVVKELGELQEWSYGYETLKASDGEKDGERVRFLEEQRVFEVSPVLKGAGIDTRTLSVKSDLKAAIPFKSTAVTTMDAPFDGPGAEANLKADGDAAYYRSAFAWIDPEADDTTKAAYRFIHHEVSAEGDVGAANARGCVAGIAVLNGARGGTTIPDADRQGVYDHLAGHLKDAELEPPELKSSSELAGGTKLLDSALRYALDVAVAARYADSSSQDPAGEPAAMPWIADYDPTAGYAIVCLGMDDYRRVDFTVDEASGSVTLADSDQPVEPSTTYQPKSLRFTDEADAALAAADRFVSRARALAAVRVKEGRVFSSQNRERLSTLRKRLAEIQSEIDELLKETEPAPAKSRREIEREFLRYQRTVAAV